MAGPSSKKPKVFNTDAAKDEYVAGKAMRCDRDGEKAYFPNLKINKKDSTHAVRDSACATM